MRHKSCLFLVIKFFHNSAVTNITVVRAQIVVATGFSNHKHDICSIALFPRLKVPKSVISQEPFLRNENPVFSAVVISLA